MSNVISKISVELLASAAGVKRGVAEAKGALSSYGSATKKIKGNPFAQAEKGAQGFGGTLGGLTSKLGAFAAAFGVAFSAKAMADGVLSSLEMMDSQKELADQLGISVKALSGLSYISDIVGGDTEALSGSFAKFQKLMGNAANGQKQATDTLEKYGLTAKQLIGLPLEEQMGIISDKFKGLHSQEQKVVMATDLFGKSGVSMINMLSLGSTEIDKMIEKAKSLGVVFDDDMAKKASDAEDAMKNLSMAWKGMSLEIANDLAPSLITLIDDFTTLILKAKEYGKAFAKATSNKENSISPFTSSAYLAGGTQTLLDAQAPAIKKAQEDAKKNTPAGTGVLKPLPMGKESPVTQSLFGDILKPSSIAAAGSGVLSTAAQAAGAQGGKDYIDSFWDSARAGGTGDPSLDLAKKQSEDAQQRVKQWALDLEQRDKLEKEAADAAKEKQKILKDQTDEYDKQVKALEDAKKIQGGFEISKAGRVAAGADFTTGGIMPTMSSTTFGGESGNGSIGGNREIVSELQEQTGYLRVLAAKPNVPVFG